MLKGFRCDNCMKLIEQDRYNYNSKGEFLSVSCYCEKCSQDSNIYFLIDKNGYVLKWYESFPPESSYTIKVMKIDNSNYQDFLKFMKSGRALIKEGYLCILKDNLSAMYFHRMVVSSKINNLSSFKQRKDYEVHHINKNTLDNRKINLELIPSEEHKEIHKSEKTQYIPKPYQDWVEVKHEKAFETYCSKKYGMVNPAYYEEFEEWIERKENESY